MKSIGMSLRGRSVSAHLGRVLLFVCLLSVAVSSVRAEEISVTNRGDFGNISVMELTGNFDADLPDGTVNTAPRMALAKEFYRTHQDDYDFLIFFTNFDYQMPTTDTAGYYLPIKNDVQGLGIDLFDHSGLYGSDGHLQGSIDMRSLGENGSSPLDPAYTHTLNTLEHEVLHRWSAHVKFLAADGSVSEALLGPDRSHWNYLLDSNGSLQYGNDWRDNGDGTFTSVAIRQNYSPLDLYLMGMIDKSAVPPMLLIDSPAFNDVYLPKLGDTISGSARTVSIEQIIAAMGERIPAANEAPKSFKAAFIFVTRPDTFSGKELTSLEAIRNGFLTRFSILTDGQGLVQVTPTLQPELPVNPGIEQPDFLPRTLPPSLEEGVAWLRTQQQENGCWADVDQTAVRDTTETLAALGIFGADPGLDLGAAWLNDVVPDSTDYLARRLEALALAGSPVTTRVNELFERQNADGGWGSTSFYQSNPTDTSLALRALVRAGQELNPLAAKAATYLAENQNADGGWGGNAAFSMVQPSAHALVALNPYKNRAQISDSLERGKSFLLAKQNTDGGFGNSPSTIYDSSAALLALGEVGAAAVSTRQAVTYLEDRQLPGGSWYDSPFQTAAAVQALWRATLDPDLAVSSTSISLIPEQISHLPTEQVVSVVVENLGRTDVQQGMVALYEGAVDAEHLLLEQTAAFPGLGSTTLTFPLTLDVARTYSLIVVVDPSDQVAELDEANNRSGKTLKIEETRDFIITDQGLSVSKTDLLQGEGVTITAQLSNAGTVAAYDVPVRFFLLDGSSEIEIAAPQIDLPSGQSRSVEVVWHASHPGDNLQIVAVVDPHELFAELDETNNRAATSLRVTGTQLPNLVFDSVPQFSSEPALQDGATDISVVLMNSGSVTALNVPLSFYQGAPDAGGLLLGTTVVPEIKPGERLPVLFDWRDIVGTGEQLVVVRADVDAGIAEVVESDNQTLSRLMVLSRADLGVAEADVSIFPSAPREGEAVNVAINLYNHGEQDAVNATVVLGLDGIEYEQVAPLVAAQGWTRLEFALGDSLSSGVHNLQIVADPANSIRELNEENNRALLNFGVQNADLWVSEPYFSPNGDGIKDTAELYYRFSSPEVVQLKVRNDTNQIVRNYIGDNSVAAVDGRLIWDGRNDRGALVADGPYQMELVSEAGVSLGILQVVVDTNRSSLFAALETEFVLDEVLVCDLPSRAQWEWLPDEKRLLFAITNSTTSDYETGLYSKDVATGEISRLVPDEWISSNPLVSYAGFKFFMSADKSRLVLEFNKRDKKTLEVSNELWLLDSRGRGLQKLRDYSGSYGVRNLLWSPTGQHLLIAAEQSVELVETENLTGKILDVPSTYNFAWAPDGSRLLRSGLNLTVIELDGSSRDVFNESDGHWLSDGYWLNSQQLVAVALDSSEREHFIWRVDSSGVDAPLLLSDDYSHSLVIAPDGKHIAFVEGLSTTGGVKQVSIVDESGHKTTIHETPYQTKDRQYSNYDTNNGMGIISNLLWSQDGKRLAYVDRLAAPIAESTFVPKLLTYAVAGGEQTSTPLFGCSSFMTYSCDSAGTCWSGCDDVEPQLEMGRVKGLLHWSKDGRSIAIEAEDSTYLLDMVTGEKRVLPVVNPIYFSPNLDEVLYKGSACNNGDIGVWRFSSLLNMAVGLRPVRERSAISLYGTAADMNFASYRLEYADALQPDHWLPVQPPVTKAVADEYLTLWVPPQAGSYLVRLTVEDKAGNQGFSRKRVNWAQASVLSGFYRSTDIFSPNGDGILDNMELSYRVLSATQFTAEVKNADGEVVRSFARSYSQPLDDAIVWDGRDDAGQVVPDGFYELTLPDFSFGVEVDATLPVAKISFTPMRFAPISGNSSRWGDKSHYQIALKGDAEDLNLIEQRIEVRHADEPWIKLLSVEECNDAVTPSNTDSLFSTCLQRYFVDAGIGDLRFSDYRIVAEDRAGNASTLVAEKPEEVFILALWGEWPNWDLAPDPLPIIRKGEATSRDALGFTTYDETWQFAELQYWLDGLWHQAEAVKNPKSFNIFTLWLENYTLDKGKFWQNWNGHLVTDQPYKVRLRAVNAAGEERFSNELATDTIFGIDRDCLEYTANVNLFENLTELHAQMIPEKIIDAQMRLFPNKTMLELIKELPNSSWQTYKQFDVIPGNLIAAERNPTSSRLPLPENAGERYGLRLIGTSVSGVQHQSEPYIYLSQPSCPPEVSLEFDAPCSLEVPVVRDLTAKGEEGVRDDFLKLEFFHETDNGLKLLKALNNPNLDHRGIFGKALFDTSNLEPGAAKILVRLTYLDLLDGQEKSVYATRELIVPDRSLPQPTANFDYPLNNTVFNCRDWRLPDGSWRGLSIEGTLASDSALQEYQVCTYGRDAAGDLKWSPIVNSAGFVSPDVAGKFDWQGQLGQVSTAELFSEKSSKLRLIAYGVDGQVGGEEISLVTATPETLLTTSSLSPAVFSPNGDGRKDQVSIGYHLTRDAYVTLLIHGMGNEVHLQERQFQLAGDHQLVWGGLDSNQARVGDGIYAVNIEAEEIAGVCSLSNKVNLSVEVDTTPPIVEIEAPLEQSSYFTGNVVDVRATTNETNIDGYLLEVASVTDPVPQHWQQLSDSNWNSQPIRWDTSGQSGPWSVRASAEDSGGNIGSAAVAVDIVDRRLLLKSLMLLPGIISPNGDGRQDQLELSYQLLERTSVQIEILDSAEQVRFVHSKPTAAPGVSSWVWNGYDETGNPAPDGDYRLRLTAVSSVGTGLSQTEELSFIVDTVAPILELIQPLSDSYLAQTTVTFAGGISDLHLSDYQLSLTGPEIFIATDSGTVNRVDYSLALPDPLQEGDYKISASANDLAGNRTELIRQFTLDRTPPLVEFQSPSEGAGFGIEAPLVAIAGTINDEHLAEFQLRYGPGDAPQQWQTLQVSGTTPASDVRFDWGVGLPDGLPDGRYTLSLLATDRAGLEGEVRRQILIDNHPPTALIDLPAEGALLNDSFTITGTAADGNFKSTLVELSPGSCQTASRWSALPSAGESLENRTLAEMLILPADGDYCLRLTVTDLVGNRAQALRNLSIDTTPPAPPVLSGDVVVSRDVQLSWATAGESDISGFRIYRDEVLNNQQQASESSFTDPHMLEGEYRYHIQAFDRAGNSSDPSNLFTAIVDSTPPLTKLTNPANAARVGDLIEIRGTAYSENDFAEYRVSYGFGEQPLEWTELRRSPVPISGSRLVQWDSWGLPDGLYSLRLEAEDLSGNQAVDTVQVEIDNTPPQAPTLNLPAVLQADVSLTWKPNPESDIAGYLLYRNGRLANASGVVIGPLTPYLLAGLDYQDARLKDGNFVYTLIAVDLAGNQSLPSAERVVEIDTHAPRASIVEPRMGESFEAPLAVVADSEDLDIASIQLQYRSTGTELWQNLGVKLNSPPYAATLDPNMLSLSFGELELRALATDRGGQVGPDPAVTRIEYRDMTPPVAPVGLTVSFDCDEVALDWSASAEADLAGYNVYRTYDNGYLARQNSQPLQVPTWIHTFGGGTYTFVVKAVDRNGNESLSSETVSIQLKTPVWGNKEELTVDPQLDLSGTDAFPNARVQLLSKGTTVAESLTDNNGLFAFAGVSLVRGGNEFTVVAIDSEGSRSCISDPLLITKTILLPPPEGFQDLVTGLDVQLDWQQVVDPELDQYYVYRDGKRLEQSLRLVSSDQMTASADSYYSSNPLYTPAMAIDGNINTGWYSNYRYGENKWLQIDFDQPKRVKWFELRWPGSYWTGVDFEIQIWDRNDWQTVSKVNGNYSSVNYISLGSAHLTDKVRLYITAFNNPSYYAGVREFKIYKEPVIDSPTYNDRVYRDGRYDYQVSSVNTYGMEGPLSPIYSVGVGDAEPPASPTNLTVTVPPEGRSLHLAWEAGSADTDYFTVYRAARSGGPYEMVGTTDWDRLSFVDTGLTDGTRYFYVVTASDQFNNESLNSLESSGTPLDLLPPESPSLFYPTVPGLDKVVYQETTAIRGLTEPDATVKLFTEGFRIAETVSLSVPEINSVQYDFSGMDTLLSPHGDYLVYLDGDRYDDGLVLRDLAARTEVLIAERVEYYVWSGDGKRITYTYDDLNYNDFVAFYIVETGENTTFTSDLDVDIDYLSSSADGRIVAFVSDIGGDDDVWVKDLQTGTQTQLSTGLWGETTAVAPDGTKVAYYDDDDEILYVADLVGGATVAVDLDPYWRHFEWSPDSRYLAYLSYSKGNKDLYVYDSVNLRSDQLTDNSAYKYDLHWAPDGRSIIYEQSSDDSIRLHLLSGEEFILASDLVDLTTLQWLSTGEIVFINDDSNQVNYLLSPGTFTFDGVALHPGENQFYVNATDKLDRFSPMSDSISVIYDTSRLPDIVVAENEVFIVPSVPVPGERVVANVLVRNNTGTAAQDVKVDFYLWDSQSNLEFLESRTITQLDGEGTATLSFPFTASVSSGRSSLLVVADPENVINELIESNNFVDRAFQVTSDGGVQMSIALTRETISSRQDLEINLELLNNSQAVDGRLEMKILDQAGHLVEILSQGETRLDYGLKQFDYVWNSGVLFAGEYQIWGGLYDNQDRLLAEQQQPFTILPDRSATLNLTTDRTSYGANDPVLLEIDLQNSGANDILSNLQLKTVITDASGQELFSDNQPVSQLLPDMSSLFTAAWNTARYSPGDLKAVCEVWLTDRILQSETVNFQILPVSKVKGILGVEPQSVVYGLDFKLPFSVSSSGNQSAVGKLRVALFDPAGLSFVGTSEQDVTILVGGKISGEFSFSSTDLKLQTYRARLSYVNGDREQLISEEPLSVVDGLPPELVVKSPVVGETYRQLVDFEVVASDDISGVASVSYRLDTGDWQLLPFADLAAGRYATTWHPALKDNGAHKIEFVVQDHAGNTQQSRPIDFELQMDVAPPVTQLEAGLPYYKSSESIEYLAATSSLQLLATDDISGVALTEYRVDSGEWVSYVDAISLTGLADGEHVVGFRSIDALGNVETENYYNFVIDNASPVITVVTPMAGEFYNSDVLTQVEISDLLPIQRETVLLRNGELVGSHSLISDEGEYRFDITTVDSLGNRSSETVEFTIDKTAPVIVASGFTDAAYYNTDVTPLVVVSDSYLATSTLQINGSDLVSGTVIGAEGQYDLSATGSDFAGNIVAENWSFIVDKKAPESRLEFADSYYQASGALFVSPQTKFSLLSVDHGLVPSGVDHIEYAFTQQAAWNNYVDMFDLASLSEGNQTINYRALDRAGNLEETRSLSVVLDRSAPATDISYPNATFTGTDGTLFVSGITGFELSAGDNLSGVVRTTYRIDGDVWADFAPFTLAGLPDGVHQIDYFSIDRVANQEPPRTLIVTADNSPPATSIKVDGTQHTDAGSLFATATANISLSATDNLSGVAMTEYRIDGGAWTSFAPFSLDGLSGGQHVIGFRSADNVANIEVEQELTLAVDNAAPITDINLGDPKFSTAGIHYVTAASEFALVAADNLSGVKRVEYRLDNGAWTPYVPFNLAGLVDGEHIIGYRSIDNLDNVEVEKTLAVIVDRAPPTTSISVGTPQYSVGNLHVGAETEFTLTSSDIHSGVAGSEYRIDGGSWSAYAPFTLNGLSDGTHIIGFRSFDNLNNVETEQELSLVIDNTAPLTTISVENPQYTGAGLLYVTGATGMTLSATDNLSGVATTEYRIDAGVWTPYAPFNLAGLSDGEHSIGYRSTDSMRNLEVAQTLRLVVDNAAPASTLQIMQPQTNSLDRLYVTSMTSFELSASDALAGVTKLEYRIDGTAWTEYAPFTIDREGEHLIGYRSTDNLGNQEVEQTVSVTVDNTPPVTEIAYGTPQFVAADGTIYVGGTTAFTLTASDNLCGVATTEYRVDGGSWTSYAAFTLSGLVDGAHSIAYRSSDSLGNLEEERVLSVIVDNTAPVTVITAGAPQSTDTGGTLYVTGATEFTLAATDSLSGVATSEYRIDAGAWTSYAAFTLSGLADGTHSIGYRSVDPLGNIEDERTLSLVIDNTAAVTEILTGTPQFMDLNGSLFVTGATKFTLAALDDLSGVATSEYRIDGGVWTDYAPFSLSGSAEGDVFIEFRSADNLGNLETERSLIVVVDNTPPVTSIAFNSQNYMNADQLLVTRKTEISLSAVDTLAGVDETYYRFDGQTGWTQYPGSFLLPALDFGTHTIHFRSVDHVMNMESEQSVEFSLIGVESQTSIINVPRVLVWLGENEKEQKEDKGYDEHDGKDHDINGGKDDPHDDENDDHELGSSRQDALDFLAEAFAGQDAYFRVVSSEEEYLRAFRSGVFNLTLILDEELPFEGDFIPEFVEGIRRGMGLLLAPGKHDGDFRLEELLGVKYKGRESNKKSRLSLQLYNSPLSAESEVGLTGSVLKTELTGGILAALIPGERPAEAISRMTLQLPTELHDGDTIKVVLQRRHDNGHDIVDEEWLTVEDDEHEEANLNVGNIYGDLSLSTHDDDEFNIRLASKYGSFEGVYELGVTLISHGEGKATSLADGLTLDWGTHWTVGAPVGICRVIELNDGSTQRREDLPGTVLHQFGEGRTVFLAFDLVASAKASDRSTYLSLVQNALDYLLPEQSAPEAASTELLETSIRLSGSAIDLAAVENLWPGLTYKPLFTHQQDLLEYHLSFLGGEESRYRYFVQSEDRPGTFGKETEVQFYLDGIATTYGVYPYSFGIGNDSERLMHDAIAWIDEMILLQPAESGKDDDHEDDECDDKKHDRDDTWGGKGHEDDKDIYNAYCFRELKKQLLKISFMDKDDAKRLEKVIDKVLIAMSKFDRLPVDSSQPRSWINEYLRIMEVKYYLSGNNVKKKDD